MSADAKSSRLFGIAGVVMALCCLAGPAIVAAAAGAAIGNLLGIAAAAVLVALAGVLVLRRWRGSDSNGC
jgi:maltodextrin utilization protein YvdJ